MIKPKWAELAEKVGLKWTEHKGEAVKANIPEGVKIKIESQGVGKPFKMIVTKEVENGKTL